MTAIKTLAQHLRWPSAVPAWARRLQPDAGWLALRPWLPAALALTAAGLLAGVARPIWQAQAAADETAALQLLKDQQQLAKLQPRAVPWIDALPIAGDYETRLADLLEGALRHGMLVSTVDQSAPTAPVPTLQQQHIDIGARARYVDLRSYIASTLRSDPGLALQQLTLSRAQGSTAELDVRLRFSLLQHAPAATDAPAGKPERAR